MTVAQQGLTVNLISENKSVGEYHNGAPPAFHELVSLVSSGAGAEGDVYKPEMGYLSVAAIDEVYNPADIPEWESDLVDFRLADAEEGWIEGAVFSAGLDDWLIRITGRLLLLKMISIMNFI